MSAKKRRGNESKFGENVVSIGYTFTQSQLYPSKLDTAQVDTPQLYRDYMAERLKLLQSGKRYKQSVNVITVRQKSRNRNDSIVLNVRYSIVASTLQPYGQCKIVACRLVAV